MKDKEFYRWYKRMIGNNPEVPPEHIWENIQNGLDRDLYDWYKRSTEDNAGEPPEEAWENIQKRLDKNLFQWYGQKIEDPQEEPPEEIWDNIQDKLDRNLYQWYGNSIKDSGEEPPEEVWDNIQDQLDINDTWTRISTDLDKQKTRKKTMYVAWAAAAALLIFLLMQVFSPLNQDLPFTGTGNQNKQITEQSEPAGPGLNNNTNSIQEKPSDSEEKLAADASKNTDRQKENGSHGKAKTKFAGKVADNKAELLQEQQLLAQTNQPALSRLEPQQMQFEVNTKGTLNDVPQRNHTTVSLQEVTSDKRQMDYYLGLTGEIGNSWLLSKKTLYSIRSSPYSAVSPNQGNSFGLTGGINMNTRLSFQLEALLQNENGQSYKEYSNGQVINNHIYLDYASLDLLARYKIIQSSLKLPVSQNIVLGMYGSYLKNAQQEYNNQLENLRSAYKNYDIGVVVGYELDTQIAPNYTISTGLRFDPGLINIYQGVPSLPAHFNKTYSSSVSITLSIKYNITNR